MKSEGHAELAPSFAGPGKAGLVSYWTLQQENWPLPSGELVPALRRDGSTPHHRQQ